MDASHRRRSRLPFVRRFSSSFAVASLSACTGQMMVVEAGVPTAGSPRVECRYIVWHTNSEIKLGAKVTPPCRTEGTVTIDVLERGSTRSHAEYPNEVVGRSGRVLTSAPFRAPDQTTRFVIRVEATCYQTGERLVGADSCEAP